MLTLEQIQEGRARLHRAEAGVPGAVEDLGAWFEEHGAVLLDVATQMALAERARSGPELDWVAHDEVAPFPTQVVPDAARDQLSRPLSPKSEPTGFVLTHDDDGTSTATYLNAKGEPVHNPHDLGKQAVDAAGQLAAAERARARERWDELRPACVEEFRERTMVVNFAVSVDPRAYSPNNVQAWLRARGLEATVMVNPSNPRDLLVDPLRVIR